MRSLPSTTQELQAAYLAVGDLSSNLSSHARNVLQRSTSVVLVNHNLKTRYHDLTVSYSAWK